MPQQPKDTRSRSHQGRQHLMTTDVAALLEIVGRVQREHIAAPARVQLQEAGVMTPEQLAEWFARERYVYGEHIAEGGMARIYCAADLHLCRTVALKSLVGGQVNEGLSRFIMEAQVTAQLQHPNVVPIYDVGLDPHTNLPFFAMKLISGRSVLDIILGLRHKDPDVRRFASMAERIGIFLKACDAIAYAHACHVVHRDIKPSNLMVGDFGEVYVIDWGIAESRGELPPPDPKTGKLRFGVPRVSSFHDVYHLSGSTGSSFMGSPVHMAPEQILAPDEVDERSDIYGLGCTLYEFITLRAPFDASWSIERLLTAKRTGRFPPVWRYKPAARFGIGEIVHKCMAPRKSDRYASVQQVQKALKDYLHSIIHHEGPKRIRALEEYVASLGPEELSLEVRRELARRISAVKRHCPASGAGGRRRPRCASLRMEPEAGAGRS